LRFFLRSSTVGAAVSGGAMNCSSRLARRTSVAAAWRSSRSRLAAASRSAGLRKYSPDWSCLSSLDRAGAGGKGV
jgi:hypothetical protein